MKQLLTGLLLSFGLLGFSQEFDKEAISTISVMICDCLNNKDYSNNISEGTDKLENCMTSKLIENIALLKKKKGIDITDDSNQAKGFGEKIPLHLISNCQKSVPLIMELGRRHNKQKEESREQESEESEELSFLVGKITDVEKGTFPILKIVDMTGAKHNVLWLTIVDNPVLFEEALKGKKNFILEYFENELYDPRIKEYRYMKVLNAVKIQE